MAPMPLVLIVDRTGSRTGNCADSGSGTTARNRPDRGATRGADSHSPNGSARPMMPVMVVINHMVVNHIGHHRRLPGRVVDCRLNIGRNSLRIHGNKR
jgi:hypothetical protein